MKPQQSGSIFSLLLLLSSFALSIHGATIKACPQSPVMAGVPNNNWDDQQYSPFLCYKLDGLTEGKYYLKVWSLETITPLPSFPDCSGPQTSLCNYTTTFDNSGANFRTSREVWVLQKVQNYQWDRVHFVVRLWKNAIGSFTGVGCQGKDMCYEKYVPTTNRSPPILNRIPDLSVTQGKVISFQASARGGSGGNITFSIYPPTPNLKINPATGFVSWQTSRSGNFTFAVSALQGTSPTLYDSQFVSIEVKKLQGIPTPKPTPTSKAVAALVKVEKALKGCLWYVTIALRRFVAGPISVVGRGALSHCINPNKPPENYYWSSPNLVSVKKRFERFTFLQHDYGNYTYIFTDSKNNTASVFFAVPKPAGNPPRKPSS